MGRNTSHGSFVTGGEGLEGVVRQTRYAVELYEGLTLAILVDQMKYIQGIQIANKNCDTPSM